MPHSTRHQYKTIWYFFFSKFSFIIIPPAYHTQSSNFSFLIWSNIKTSGKSAVTVIFFVNFENQFFLILFSESFFETYSTSLAQVSWFRVGGLGLCDPNKPAINNWEVTLQSQWPEGIPSGQ
jgi:hypothetical protein